MKQHVLPALPLSNIVPCFRASSFRPFSIMSQADIDAFVLSASNFTLTIEGVTAAVTRGIPVNGSHSSDGWTALHYAVHHQRRKLVVALLAAGADANVKDNYGRTSVWRGALQSTAEILQLLIDGGSSVNESDNYGLTPLIVLARSNNGDAAARLQVLLACPELNLDARYGGITAEEWAASKGDLELAVAIAEERRRRMRWNGLRSTWIAAIAAPPTFCATPPAL
jgi:ankyrin repeat protein